MRYHGLSALILSILLMSCSDQETPSLNASENSMTTSLDIPDTCVHIADLSYDAKKSRWTLNKLAYSGYAVSFYEEDVLMEKFGLVNGKKQHLAFQWYPDGHYKRVASYSDGKLSGDKKTWSSDTAHLLLSHLKYERGRLHGEQKVWYATGELFKKMNFNRGKEEGLQQAFRKNGDLFANYEARAGRIYGLKKATLCYGLEDENIQLRAHEK